LEHGSRQGKSFISKLKKEQFKKKSDKKPLLHSVLKMCTVTLIALEAA
jgi:hypothetical protein